ncbi:MAG TPA: FliM/FliN family flagellar motor switch protein [Polyangiaceae bacterium]
MQEADGPARPVKPFPWTALDRTTRAAAQATRAARQWAEAEVDAEAIPRAAAEVLGVRVSLLLRGARPLAESGPLPGGVGVLLARADSPQIARSMLVEADGALVAAILARVLRRPAARVTGPAAALGAASAGAFAALLVAVLRRAHRGGTLRVLAAGPAPELEGDLRRAAPDASALTLTALVDDDAFEARVVLSPAAALASTSLPWSVADLTTLGPLPLEVPVVACACASTVAEVASLAMGDVLLPGPWRLKRVPSGLAGPVLLAPAGSDMGVAAHLGDDGRLVLRGGTERLVNAEAKMEAGAGKAELVDAMGDVPVVIRVEIGEARMAAREWARLGAGDVVALGRRIGEKVVLRVGGVPVARGDLVDVEGEVGVRIVERITGDGSAP